MKTVFFIRHAKSSWADASLSDIDRPLNKRGLRDAPFMSQLLKGKGVTVDKIISSPANRAYTTATYFADAFEIAKQDILVRREIYEAWTEDVLGLVRGLDQEWNSVLIFGHNPCFTSLANLFSSSYIPNVPTCGISQVVAEVDNWAELTENTGRLHAFYYPKQYFD
ncbi:MAG: histidine phosphatase family protein [Bacteroidota bacterium]